VVLRDGTAAVRFDAHAADDSLDEVSSDDDSVDHDQMDRDAQHDADEFPDISATSATHHDAHAAGGQGRHSAPSSRPAPIGQLHGGDAVESSSSEEEEEEEDEEEGENEADDNRGNDSTDSIIDRIMRHHNERAQPQSSSGGNVVFTESNTTIVSSSSLSFSRNVLSSSSSAASVSAPSGPDLQALRSLLDVGVESSLARLREKAAQRMAQAVQEQKDLRRHQVELEDLMQIAASREEEEEKRAQRADDDHVAAVRGDERHDFDGERASEPAWSHAHEQDKYGEEEHPDEEDPRRSSSDEEERDSDRYSDASAEWQREEMQRNDDRDGDDGDVGGVQFFDLNGTRDHGGENETDEAEAEAAGQASRANAYAASTAADSGAPSAAASRHGLLMSLRERVDALQAAEARERPATARGRPAPPTLASFTAGAATSSSSSDAGAASGDSELHSTSLFYPSSDALSFLRIDPARARHLHQQFAREQRSFDERHEPTAIPDPDLQTIPPAEGRDDLDPSNFRS
jgi:hypothetical protein